MESTSKKLSNLIRIYVEFEVEHGTLPGSNCSNTPKFISFFFVVFVIVLVLLFSSADLGIRNYSDKMISQVSHKSIFATNSALTILDT
ncbi:hypothetical protein BpHYR1_013606 [Brachionus plicatilis]|uniref:Uncharacterized protein n=1 Tax=Brachionus plicatilis TaxID=10195 RepID=A0A3M7Q342_BRAPC|nr:hypothetical protein BpHYR1_013606 [Brachionus plicatilis]